MVLVVALAGVLEDQAVLDAALHPAGHVVVDGGEAAGHATGLVIAIEGTLLGLRLFGREVDSVQDQPVFGCIFGEDTAQTMFAQRTSLAVADGIALGFSSEEGFFLCHTYRVFGGKGSEKL